MPVSLWNLHLIFTHPLGVIQLHSLMFDPNGLESYISGSFSPGEFCRRLCYELNEVLPKFVKCITPDVCKCDISDSDGQLSLHISQLATTPLKYEILGRHRTMMTQV
jgi:hypothetical protein